MKKSVMALVVFFIVSLTAFGAVPNIFGDDIEEIPSGWNISKSPSEKASAGLNANGDVELRFNTSDAAAKGNARIITGYYNANGDQISISMQLEPNFGQDVEGFFRIMDSNTQHMTELITVENAGDGAYSLKFFRDACQTEINERTVIRCVINSEYASGALFVGESEEPIYSGEIPNFKEGLDFSNLRFLMQLSAKSKIQANASLCIGDLTVVGFSGAYNFETVPENGALLVDSSVIGDIKLRFGIPISPLSEQKDNFKLYCGTDETDFSIEKTDEGLTVIPDGGSFEPDTEYKLLIKKITDIYGEIRETDKEIKFKTATDNYRLPRVSISADKETLTAGDTALINIEVTESEPLKTEIYLNDGLITEFSESRFLYSFSSDKPGEYTVYAKAYDSYGGIGSSDRVLITVTENAPPKITVEGISDNDVFVIGEDYIPVVSAFAEDGDGIDSMEVYVDGLVEKTVYASAVTYDISNLSAGTHTITFAAYDNFRFSSKEVYTVTVESGLYIDYSYYDYSDYTGGNVPPQGHQGGSQRGYLAAEQIDEEHGISAIIGMDTVNEEYAVGNGAYIGFPMNGTANKFSIEMDLYVKAAPASDDQYKFMIRGSDGSATLAYIQPTQIWCQTGGSSPYKVGEWTKLKFVFDKINSRFEYYADGVKIGGYKELAQNIGAYNWLRLFSPDYDAVKTAVAVDNVKVTIICETPEIIMTKEVYDADAESVSFTVRGDLDYTSLSEKKIKISSEFGEIKINSISLAGGIITVNLGQKLEANTSYRLTISKDVKFSTGSAVGASSSAVFKTSEKTFDITDGGFVSQNGMLKLKLSVVNRSGEERFVYVLMETFKNGEAEGSEIKKVLVGESSSVQNLTLSTGLPKPGCKIKAFVLEGIEMPKSLVKSAYVY